MIWRPWSFCNRFLIKMSYLRDTAIILKREPFREHDAWVTLYGREHGKLVGVARGAERMEAKALGHLEPLSEVEVMIAKGSAFDKIAVARSLCPRLRLRERLPYLAIAGSFSALVSDLTHPGASDAHLYDLLIETLDLASLPFEDPTPERSRLLFAGAALKLLDLLGYAPQMQACAVCHKPLEDRVLIGRRVGGFVCQACAAQGEAEQALCLDTVRLLRFFRHRPLKELLQVTAPVLVFREASQAVSFFLYHTPLTTESKGMTTVFSYAQP